MHQAFQPCIWGYTGLPNVDLSLCVHHHKGMLLLVFLCYRGKGIWTEERLICVSIWFELFWLFSLLLSQGYSYMVCQYTVGQITFCLHVWKIKTVEILMLNSTKMANKENIFCFNLGGLFSVCNTDRLTLTLPVWLVNLNLLVIRRAVAT